ncbi:MAG: cation:dicarboxylase symporter family transporter [Cellvibrionales bacterium]|nr:cation:dicarboxylase symporter family transporter [Cellvibrionales bacterium]
MSLTQKIIISLIAGIITGLLLGYPIQGTEVIGKAFVMLLQMTAIPYICVSLIAGIGFLDKETALKLMKSGALVYLGLTAIMLCFIYISAIAFPNWQASSFYSANTLVDSNSGSLLNIFIPSNPFTALSKTQVPAIVLFCVLLGVGFMSVEYRNQTLLFFKDIQQALVNVNSLVLKLAPVGVFCISQHASASLSKEEIDGLVVYITSVTLITFVLTFIVIPGLIASITPFTYRQVIYVSKDAMLTAFVTGHILIVLPIIAEKVKKLINQHVGAEQNEHNLAEVIAPISFSVPTGSKLISLSFIVFAAWFDGQPIQGSDYALLSVLGFSYLFNSNYGAIADLITTLNITSGLYDLFVIAENLIVRHLGGIIGAMFCVALTVLTTVACAGIWQFHWRKGLLFLSLTLSLFASLLFGIGRGFEIISHQYQGYERFIDRYLMYKPAGSKIIKDPFDESITDVNKDTLDRIKQRGVIRFGYYQDALPFAFNNKNGQLVGLDIELIHMLARELKVEIEFVKVTHAQTQALLRSGYLDMASGIPLISENLTHFSLSIPYTYEKMAFIVKDKHRHDYKDLAQVANKENLVIGIPGSLFYKEAIDSAFPNANIEILPTPRKFFVEKHNIDAMVFGAAGASAWTLVYPEYSVVTPKQELSKIPISFAIPPSDHKFELFLRNWITLNTNNGNIDKIFRYWIEGKN